MKKVNIFLVVFMILNTAFAQENKAQNNIKTTVFTLNLGDPTKDALSNSDTTKRLVLPTRNLLAFKLENGNPYKYRYVINSRVVNFFEYIKFNYLDSVGKKIQIPKAGSQDSSIIIKDSLKQKLSYSYNAQQIIRQNELLANSLLIKFAIPENEEAFYQVHVSYSLKRC